MGLKKLWEVARPIPQELELVNKYTWLSYNKILPAKYLDVNDMITHQDITIKNYISTNEAVLVFPNIIEGEIVDLFIYPIYNKTAPLKLGSNLFPYNLGDLRVDFRYGDPIVLVEGIADLAALKLVDKDLDIVAMGSNTLSKANLELLAHLTNNFIIIPDSDDAGSQGFTRMWHEFRKYKANAVAIEHFKYLKDTGDLLDRVVYYYKTADNNLLDEIQVAWQFYITAIETEKRGMR